MWPTLNTDTHRTFHTFLQQGQKSALYASEPNLRPLLQVVLPRLKADVTIDNAGSSLVRGPTVHVRYHEG